MHQLSKGKLLANSLNPFYVLLTNPRQALGIFHSTIIHQLVSHLSSSPGDTDKVPKFFLSIVNKLSSGLRFIT